MTGAASATESVIWRSVCSSNGRWCSTSTEPITSPPTSDGRQVVRSALLPQTSHESRPWPPGSPRCGPAMRIARQESGAAPSTPCGDRASPGAQAVTGSRRTAELLRLRIVTWLDSVERVEVADEHVVGLGLRARDLQGARELVLLAAPPRLAPRRALDADPQQHGRQQREQRDQRDREAQGVLPGAPCAPPRGRRGARRCAARNGLQEFRCAGDPRGPPARGAAASVSAASPAVGPARPLVREALLARERLRLVAHCSSRETRPARGSGRSRRCASLKRVNAALRALVQQLLAAPRPGPASSRGSR